MQSSIEDELNKVNNFIKELRHTLITEPDGKVFALMEEHYRKVMSQSNTSQHHFKSTRSQM
jgi:hypothetical protein